MSLPAIAAELEELARDRERLEAELGAVTPAHSWQYVHVRKRLLRRVLDRIAYLERMLERR